MKKPVKKYGDNIYTPVAAAKKIISKLEFPFGWATAAVYIKRGYHGPTQWGWIDSF